MDKKIAERGPIAILYILSTFFFLLQHKLALSWDFSAYVLNARYLFYGGTYFEVLRAPLAPILLGIVLIFGKLGEYLFVFFISTLFLISILKLSEIIFKKNYYFYTFIFYFFSLSPFVLKYAINAGTEMLGLSFLILFFYSFLKSKTSGQYLGLAILTRYSYLMFIPFLLFSKEYKKMLKNFFYLIIAIFPWLLYNRIKFGNWFASIVDSYALNVHFRGYLFESITLLHFHNIIGWFLPFIVIGLTYSIYKISKTKSIKKNKIEIIMFAIAILVIYDFLNIPLKEERYLFVLSLPIAYFSSIGLIRISESLKNKFEKIIVLGLITLFLFSILSLTLFNYNNQDISRTFKDAGQEIKNLGIENCEIFSPHWVPITYYTENVYPIKNANIIATVEEGKIVLILKNQRTIDDNFNESTIEVIPKIFENEKYVFLAKQEVKTTCTQKYTYDKTIITNHCEIIASKFEKIRLNKLAIKTCNLIN